MECEVQMMLAQLQDKTGQRNKETYNSCVQTNSQQYGISMQTSRKALIFLYNR